MKVLAFITSVLVGSALAAPAKLDGLDHHHHHHDPLIAIASAQAPVVGYNYDPPAQPSGLYELPAQNSEKVEPSGPTTTMMPMPYNIKWGVSDPESGNIFNHVEDSDGKDVTGEYSVLLPDNRMQIVRFRVDPINGYQAEVTYEPVK
ncbi:Pro-resilin-like 100 [Homarus americanus]|uniref:Pro-resilin-like 100 n=1 Tax=Homarus americanus TaxID=6706 RepID=A0A8J5MYF5_HOMAM|nr:Pro-resilin-like 100 [Homarus americanus]